MKGWKDRRWKGIISLIAMVTWGDLLISLQRQISRKGMAIFDVLQQTFSVMSKLSMVRMSSCMQWLLQCIWGYEENPFEEEDENLLYEKMQWERDRFFFYLSSVFPLKTQVVFINFCISINVCSTFFNTQYVPNTAVRELSEWPCQTRSMSSKMYLFYNVGV